MSSKILQKYLWSSSFFVKQQTSSLNFTKNELLHKSFQGFFIDYQNILFPEMLIMDHIVGWVFLMPPPIMNTPLYCLPHLS